MTVTAACFLLVLSRLAPAGPPTDDQDLARNVAAVAETFDRLRAPLTVDAGQLKAAIGKADGARLEQLLDPLALLTVTINPESRVKVVRGEAPAELRQGTAVPVLVKVVNDAGVTAALRPSSPQGDPAAKDRLLDLAMVADKPLSAALSGRPVEYAVLLVTCREGGRREATLGFDVGQGTQDLGFRGEVAVLFSVRAAGR